MNHLHRCPWRAAAGLGARALGCAAVLAAAGTTPLSGATAGEPARAAPRHRIAWAARFGGEGWEEAREIRVLPDGSVLVGAQTSSAGMPVTPGVLQPRYAGDDPSLGHPGLYGGDCYLARLSPDGARLVAATYFGGSRQERNVYGMELDRAGNIVIATATRSPDAPTTEGCFQRAYGGGPSDMLVAKISPDLARIVWCTYVGGSGDDSPRGGIVLDADENVWVVGTSASGDFPTTEGALQRELRGPRDSAIAKLKADGSALLYGTLLGGSGEDDAVMGAQLDEEGALYVAGHTRSSDFPGTARSAGPRLGGASDAYVAKIAPGGRELVWATYLGGSRDEFAEHTIRLERTSAVLVAGHTASPDFPASRWALGRKLQGPGDGFLARVTRDGRRFAVATYLGGSGTENWLQPTPDPDGAIHLVGGTDSEDFPSTADALQPRYGGGPGDGALAVVTADASRLLYATYFGGSGDETIRTLALGADGSVYLAGRTSSEDFPATPGAFGTSGGRGSSSDAFVAKLEGLPAFPPGEWVSLFDGSTLSGWEPFEDEEFPDMYGKVSVEEGRIVLGAGSPMTGIRWSRNVPRDGYEIELEGMRVEGGDFFCGLSFPVADAHLSLILGGWGGSVVGISNIDGYSAVENQTTTSVRFEDGRWYRIRVRVGAERIQAWLDDEKKVDFERAGHRFSIWPQQEPGKPLGITTYATKGALRGIRLRKLSDE